MAERQLIQLGLLAANEPGSIAIGPFGSRMKAELYVATGVPIIRGTNISSGSSWKGDWVYVPEAFAAEMPNCLTRPGDLVFPHRGSIGEVALVPDDGITYMISTSLMKFRPDTRRVSPEFLLHFFRSSKGRAEILRFASQVGTPGIGQPLTSLRQFQVDLPPLPIQRAIAATLGSLNDKIELNRRMNETLEAMARAIFQDWFVTFGPTRAKMEGRPPYLAPDLWSLFPNRLDAEGKPEGWVRGALGEYMVNFDSKRIPVSGGERAKRQGPYPYHGATGVMDHVDGYLFDGSYLLVGEDGSVVRENGMAFTQYVWGKFWVNNHAHILQGKGAVSTEQLLMYFQHEPVGPFVTGAVQLKLSQGRMNAMPFVYGGEDLCRRYSYLVNPLFARLRANAVESQTLAATRDLLLPRLMSGELRVKDAERAVEAAA